MLPMVNKDQDDEALSMQAKESILTAKFNQDNSGSTWSSSTHRQQGKNGQFLCYEATKVMDSIPGRVKENPTNSNGFYTPGCGSLIQQPTDQGTQT